jgi:hypothetical protein
MYKNMIILVENEKLSLEDIKNNFFYEKPDNILSVDEIKKDQSIKTLLIDCSLNNTMENKLKSLMNLEFTVIRISSSSLFLKNNPGLRSQIYSLHKEDKVIYFKESFLSKR